MKFQWLKKLIKSLDLLSKDLMENNTIFGGKVLSLVEILDKLFMLFVVVEKEDFIRKSLLCYEIWLHLEKLKLLENMRIK